MQLIYDLFVDSRFSRILDVFVNPSTTSAVNILDAEYCTCRNGCSRYNVCYASDTVDFWVCGSSRYGKTSQAPFPYITIL